MTQHVQAIQLAIPARISVFIQPMSSFLRGPHPTPTQHHHGDTKCRTPRSTPRPCSGAILQLRPFTWRLLRRLRHLPPPTRRLRPRNRISFAQHKHQYDPRQALRLTGTLIPVLSIRRARGRWPGTGYRRLRGTSPGLDPVDFVFEGDRGKHACGSQRAHATRAEDCTVFDGIAARYRRCYRSFDGGSIARISVSGNLIPCVDVCDDGALLETYKWTSKLHRCDPRFVFETYIHRRSWHQAKLRKVDILCPT